MKLKLVVEKLDEIDSKYHDLYTEKDGKYEFTGVEGMKTQADIDRLQTALNKERADHKSTKEKYKGLPDKTVEEIVADLDRIPELEAAAKGAGNVDELVEAKIQSRLKPIERERDKYKKELDEAQTQVSAYQGKDRPRTIQDAVRAAIGKQQGFQQSAVEDALIIGERVFEIDDAGHVVTKDGVGVTPGISAEVWLTEIQNARPHWWVGSQGGGAGGNRGGASGATNPWTHEGWNLTEQGRIYREDPAKAQQMAASAGTQIGGVKPEPKK